MRAQRFDVLVIGLGPAGACAARTAAASGARVLGIDRRRELGEPVQCAEFIPNPLGQHARADGVLVQRVQGMITELPSSARVASAFPGLMIDRAAFDKALARRAKDAGAELRSGARFTGFDSPARRARIADAVGVERAIDYDVVVAADGPHSLVAKRLGLSPLSLVNTRQYTVPLRRAYTDTDIFLSDAYPGGYAWLFPKGELANIGVGADRAFTVDLKTPLDALHRRLKAAGIVGASILARTGGPIPVGGLRERLVSRRTLFVGDAAGLTHPISGAGIHAAVASGEAAGLAAVAHLAGDEQALDDFEEDVRDQFQVSLDRAVARRRELHDIWRTPGARLDRPMRRGWIAFDDYFAA